MRLVLSQFPSQRLPERVTDLSLPSVLLQYNVNRLAIVNPMLKRLLDRGMGNDGEMNGGENLSPNPPPNN